MGNSKYLFGDGLTQGVTPVVSSTKESSTRPTVSPLARGTAKLNISGQFAGVESDIYDINVLDADVANEDSELTPAEFQGQSERRISDISIERLSLNAPTGDYELECIDPGKEDTIASSSFVFEVNGVRFVANESVTNPSTVVGSVGNRIEVKIYTVHPEYGTLNLNPSTSSYPRPGTGIGLIQPQNPVNYSALSEDRNVSEYSVNRISPPEVNVPVVRSDNGEIEYQPVNSVYIDPDTNEALFLPQENTPRFVLGQSLNQQQGSLNLNELLENVFLQTIFSEYSRSQGTGIYEYAVKGTPKKSDPSEYDLPKGYTPYPVEGGYLIHVYLRAASSGSPHAADFWYTHFPLLNPNTGVYEAFPITTWGEFAYALYMHQIKGVYLTRNANPITDDTHELRYPLILVETDSTVELTPRSEVFDAWENAEISLHTSGNIGYPRFYGTKLDRILDLKVLDRNLLRQETVSVVVSEVDDIGPILDVIAPATAALPSAPPDLGQGVIARIRPGQTLSSVMGSFAGVFGLDFKVPIYESPLNSQVIPDEVDGTRITWAATLVNDTPEDPRTIKLCMHHLHASPAISEQITVNLVYKKFKASTCPPCDGFIPSPYDPSCIGGGGTTGQSTDVITNYFQQSGGRILTPIPTVDSGVTSIYSLDQARKLWSRAMFYLKRKSLGTSDLSDYLDSIDTAIDAYVDKMFKLQVVDRSAVSRSGRRHFSAPDYTLLLEGEVFDGGSSLFPVTPVDPFCDDLTSGFFYGFGGIFGNAEDGNAYTSWQTGLDLGLTDGGFLGLMDGFSSNIVPRLASAFFKEDRFNYSFDTDSQFLRDTLDHSKFDESAYFQTVWGNPPNIMSDQAYEHDWDLDWTDPIAEFVIPRIRGRGVPFDNLLHHFKYNFLDLITDTDTSFSIIDVKAETDTLIRDWLTWLRDPGEYLEDNYSWHTDYEEIFKWLYRLPQTDPEGVRGQQYSTARWDYLWRNCPHSFSLGEANPNYQLVEVSFRYRQPRYTVTEVNFGVTYTRIVQAIDEVRKAYIVVNPDEPLETILAQAALDFTGTEVLDFSGSVAVHNPSSITVTLAYLSARVYKVQDLNRGPTSYVKSRINSLLAAKIGYAGGIQSNQWEVIHMGHIPVASYPGVDSTGRSTNLSANQYSRSNGQPRRYGVASQTTGDLERKKYRNFNNFKAMEQIFWLRFMSLLAKVGWYWDIEKYLNTCPAPDRYTNIFGTALQSVGGCTNFSADTDYWEVKVTSQSRGTVVAHRAYTNHTYYDEQGMFAFLIATKCPTELEYGDSIQIQYTPEGAESNAPTNNYEIGEQFTIKSRQGAKIALQGGLSDRDTATWRLTPPDGVFPVIDLQLLNRADTEVSITSDLIHGLFHIDMWTVTRYEKGDRWTWGLAGGTYRAIRRSDGAKTAALSLSRIPVELFSGDGVLFGFDFKSRRPFVAGDKWRINLIQDHAAKNALNWDFELPWVSDGNTDETYEIPFGIGNGKEVLAAALVGHNLTSGATVTLEAKDSGDTWGGIPPSQQWSVTVYDAPFEGMPTPPVICLFSVPEGPFEQWRFRITDASVDRIRIAKVFLGNASNGVVSLEWDHDTLMPIRNIINPNDKNSDLYKSMIQEVKVSYSLMKSGSLRDLWKVFFTCKQANNQPYVWVSNINQMDKARVCLFPKAEFPYTERTGDMSGTYADLGSDIDCSMIAINPNRDA